MAMNIRKLFLVGNGSSRPFPSPTDESPRRPPTFAEARNRRQKVRAAGFDPNYWYPVEYADALEPGDVREIAFWGTSFALFRDAEGEYHVVENRCAHRALKLSLGTVDGCNLVCAYHGWSYDGDGKLVGIGHELFGHKMPRVKVASRPVLLRYGLVWVFFGDADEANRRGIPNIPELEGPKPWPCAPVDFVWKTHHSIIIDNVSDFTHAHLHRKYQPFSDAKLTGYRTEGDKVFVSYDAKIGQGPIYRLLVDHASTNTNKMELCYEYPFQWSNTDDRIKHHCFLLPIDRTTTRAFFLFYYDPRTFKVPLLPISIPRRLVQPLLHASNSLLVRPLLEQDGVAVEEEQRGYDQFFDSPAMELNPAVNAFQTLTVRKWEEHLARSEAQRKPSGREQGTAPS